MNGNLDATTGNLVDLAQYQFWGVMIAVLFVMPVMLWMILKFNNNSHVHMIDRLAIPIDGMKHSIDQLAQQLAASTASMDAMLKSIGEKVNVVSEDVDDLKVEVHGVVDTVKEHDAKIDEHENALNKLAKNRGKKK